MKGWGGRCVSKVQGLCVCVRASVFARWSR